MTPTVGDVITAMIRYNYDSPELINHALKVYGFAKGIGETEQLPADQMLTLEVGAVLHDIGIRISQRKYNSFVGPYQQIEGPPIAKEMLTELGFSEAVIDRVCFLIAHHHEYTDIDAPDYQILVEADFLVNIYEEGSAKEQIETVREKIFRTKTGIEYLDHLFRENYDGPKMFKAQLMQNVGNYGK